MIEVANRLYLNPGYPPQVLLNSLKANVDWALVHSARDPWYTQCVGKKSSVDPEYLSAWRGNELFMNIVDVPDQNFFSHALIDPAITFMWLNYSRGKNVLIHCDAGEHRSATIMLLFMAIMGILPSDPNQATAALKHIYPYFNTIHSDGNTTGIYQWVVAHWHDYLG